ncbi:MAG: hypothetical protein HYS13_10420 [Planctomycetia bacterium]|nr:hypothetical protein [Planctomycetia bacterium]
MAALVVVGLTRRCHAADTRAPLSVVFILADDLGWAEIAPYGSTLHDAPNLKRLAEGSVR